jgi:DNA polymerase-3 subunit epsilon
VVWLKLTAETYPRLSLVRKLADDGCAYLGPFGSRRAAELAAAACYDALPLRQCGGTLSARTTSPACALAELGRCPAPCEHLISAEEYDRLAAAPFRAAATREIDPLVERLLGRIGVLAGEQRYEEAAVVRTRMAALLRSTIRMQRLAGLTRLAEVVAARPTPDARWELVVVRHGRLAAAGTSPPRAHPGPTLDALIATAETVRPGPGPVPCASAEETERILLWLEGPHTRLVSTSDGWGLPARGAGRFRRLLQTAEAASAHPNVYH